MPLDELIGRRGTDEIVDSDHRDQEEDASLLIEPDPAVKSGTVAVLFSQNLMKSTLLLWIVFFGNAFLYYGIVLLTTKLSDGRSRCRGEDREGGDVALYKDVLIASFAGKIHDILILFIDRTVIDLNYFRGSGGDNICYRGGQGRAKGVYGDHVVRHFLLPLPVNARRESGINYGVPLRRAHLHHGELHRGLYICSRGWYSSLLTKISLVLCNCSCGKNFEVKVYPTSVRTTGLGIASSVGKIGGITCPLVAVGLVAGCHRTIAVLLFSAVAAVSGVAVLFFPLETKGRDLEDAVSD